MHSLLGILVGIWAERWEHFAALLTYFLRPLLLSLGRVLFRGGLPEIGRRLIALNPLFYVIDGLRYGLTGKAESDLWDRRGGDPGDEPAAGSPALPLVPARLAVEGLRTGPLWLDPLTGPSLTQAGRIPISPPFWRRSAMIPAVMPTYNRADLAFERGEGAYLFTADGDAISISPAASR